LCRNNRRENSFPPLSEDFPRTATIPIVRWGLYGLLLMQWTAPPPASQCAKLLDRRMNHQCRLLAQSVTLARSVRRDGNRRIADLILSRRECVQMTRRSRSASSRFRSAANLQRLMVMVSIAPKILRHSVRQRCERLAKPGELPADTRRDAGDLIQNRFVNPIDPRSRSYSKKSMLESFTS
jgi:hypothetical protein